MIYGTFGEEPIRFAVLNGDYTHLDGCYINVTEDEAKVDELSNLLFNEDGNYKISFKAKFPRKVVVNGAKVIVCGFAP